MNNNVISFKSKLVKEDYKSSTECELTALAHGTDILDKTFNILDDLECFNISTPIIYTDNSAVVYFIHKNGSSDNISSWDRKYHHLKQNIRQKYNIEHISGTENIADILTKGLGHKRHNYLSSKFLVP